MAITPPEILEKIEARDAATIETTAPRAASAIEQAEEAAAKAASKAASLRENILGAVGKVAHLLKQLGEARQRLEILNGLAGSVGSIPALSKNALVEAVQFHQHTDPYAQRRFLALADEVSRLRAVESALPDAISEQSAIADRLLVEVREFASKSGVDLSKLFASLREESTTLQAHADRLSDI